MILHIAHQSQFENASQVMESRQSTTNTLGRLVGGWLVGAGDGLDSFFFEGPDTMGVVAVRRDLGCRLGNRDDGAFCLFTFGIDICDFIQSGVWNTNVFHRLFWS